jgi:hypothetical protein
VTPQLQTTTTQPTIRPVNPQLRPVQQNVQVGPRAKAPTSDKCAGHGCRR